MSEALGQIKNQLNDYLQGIEKKQKIKIGLAIILFLLSLTGIIYYFTRPEYVVLYNNLDHKQSGEVMNTLQSNNIRAKFGADSNTIMVQKEDYQKSQVTVATEGLPQARFSYEDFFSGNNFMKTSEEKSKEYFVALGNELGKVIEEIPGIEKAYVNLSVPESTGFLRPNEGQSSKASVFLSLDNSTEIDSNSVKGITLLVANAVSGLEPDNVTIHGSDGRVLNLETPDAAAGIFGPTEQLSLQEKVKDDLESSITDFLSIVYGYGNVVVKANVKLDFDSEVTESQEFSPSIEGETQGIIRSMQELRENLKNSGVGGIPGTPSNTEDDITQYVEGEEGDSEYYKEDRTINYEINEMRKKITKAQGQVQDITVAVYLNSRAIAGGSLNDEEIKELENLISAAAGLDTKEVKVAVQEFNNTLADELQKAMQTDDIAATKKLPLWAFGLIGAALLGVMYFAFIRRRRVDDEVIIETPIETEETFEEIDLELAGSQVKQQLEKLVDKKPDAVAQLLRNWLSED